VSIILPKYLSSATIKLVMQISVCYVDRDLSYNMLEYVPENLFRSQRNLTQLWVRLLAARWRHFIPREGKKRQIERTGEKEILEHLKKFFFFLSQTFGIQSHSPCSSRPVSSALQSQIAVINSHHKNVGMICLWVTNLLSGLIVQETPRYWHSRHQRRNVRPVDSTWFCVRTFPRFTARFFQLIWIQFSRFKIFQELSLLFVRRSRFQMSAAFRRSVCNSR
jgi:hypothetical protein